MWVGIGWLSMVCAVVSNTCEGCACCVPMMCLSCVGVLSHCNVNSVFIVMCHDGDKVTDDWSIKGRLAMMWQNKEKVCLCILYDVFVLGCVLLLALSVIVCFGPCLSVCFLISSLV